MRDIKRDFERRPGNCHLEPHACQELRKNDGYGVVVWRSTSNKPVDIPCKELRSNIEAIENYCTNATWTRGNAVDGRGFKLEISSNGGC